MKRSKKAADSVLPRVAVSRRRFTKKLVGAAFAVPTMMSFSLDEVAFGASVQSSASFSSYVTSGFPTYLTSAQQNNSSPAMRFYCVPEDPALRVWAPQLPSTGF